MLHIHSLYIKRSTKQKAKDHQTRHVDKEWNQNNLYRAKRQFRHQKLRESSHIRGTSLNSGAFSTTIFAVSSMSWGSTRNRTYSTKRMKLKTLCLVTMPNLSYRLHQSLWTFPHHLHTIGRSMESWQRSKVLTVSSRNTMTSSNSNKWAAEAAISLCSESLAEDAGDQRASPEDHIIAVPLDGPHILQCAVPLDGPQILQCAVPLDGLYILQCKLYWNHIPLYLQLIGNVSGTRS